jgi:beta-lactam-binding protein with PASTA domain
MAAVAIVIVSVGIGLAALSGGFSGPGSSTPQKSSSSRSAPSRVTVPDLLGQSPSTAEISLAHADLDSTFEGNPSNGRQFAVTSQSPAAGSLVTRGSEVILTFSLFPAPTITAPATTAIVPNAVVVFQRSVNSISAIRAIQGAGLDPKATEEYVGPNGGNCGALVSQSPAAGSIVAVGSDVWLIYREC